MWIHLFLNLEMIPIYAHNRNIISEKNVLPIYKEVNKLIFARALIHSNCNREVFPIMYFYRCHTLNKNNTYKSCTQVMVEFIDGF